MVNFIKYKENIVFDISKVMIFFLFDFVSVVLFFGWFYEIQEEGYIFYQCSFYVLEIFFDVFDLSFNLMNILFFK